MDLCFLFLVTTVVPKTKWFTSSISFVLFCFFVFLSPQNFCFPRLGSDGFFLNLMVISSSAKAFSKRKFFEKFFLFEVRVRMRVVCWSCSEWWVCREELSLLSSSSWLFQGTFFFYSWMLDLLAASFLIRALLKKEVLQIFVCTSKWVGSGPWHLHSVGCGVQCRI
jgi:hypothetical protein